MKKLILHICDRLNLYGMFNRFTHNTATVFMIHGVSSRSESDGEGLSVEHLETFFRYLQNKSYRVISLRDYVRALLKHEKTFKSVVFTVDDGYRDFYLNAFDLFREYEYPATIFLTSDFVDRKLFLWWDQIEYAVNNTCKDTLRLADISNDSISLADGEKRRQAVTLITKRCKFLPNDKKFELIAQLVQTLEVDMPHQSVGKYAPLTWTEIKLMHRHKIYFHPHTKTHPIMSRIGPQQMREEISQPKQLIERMLGSTADIFCYPNGQEDDFNDVVIVELKKAGYSAAVTGIEGFDNTMEETDMFRLKRFPIPSNSMRFKQFVTGLERFKHMYLGH